MGGPAASAAESHALPARLSVEKSCACDSLGRPVEVDVGCLRRRRGTGPEEQRGARDRQEDAADTREEGVTMDGVG